MKDNWSDIIFIIIITCVLVIIANILSYGGNMGDNLLGSAIIGAITLLGLFIARLPLLNKLPVVFWVSLTAVILSIPGIPGSTWIVEQTKHINFLPITTPILAYAGLALGKEIEGFKKLSWRIIPVCLAVAAGSFICATLMAELMLHVEGIF